MEGFIKLFAPDRYREPRISMHTELLFPFWGVTAKDTMPYVKAALLAHGYRKEDFALVSDIHDADFVVVPYQYQRLSAVNPEKLKMIADEAHSARKPLLIDGAGDLEPAIPFPNAVVFRVSQYRYSKKPNEITIPYPTEDLLETYAGGTLSVREKSDTPSVGFTGWADLSPFDVLKMQVKEVPRMLASLGHPERGAEQKGVFLRKRAIKALTGHPRIDARIRARATYSGHINTITGSVAGNREEFVQNLLESDYALCVKGDANASVRFYEALSLGRIPLFLDTACVLPLEDKINYRDFCVFVDWRDTDRIGDVLADFHANVTPERFQEMQRAARHAYETYLRIDSFSKHISAMLHAYKNQP